MDNAESSNVGDNVAATDTHSDKIFTTPKQPLKKPKVSSTSATNAAIIVETVNLLRPIQTRKNDKDEYTLYGKQVAIKLRNITSPQARFSVQQIINNVLFEAEMGHFSYNSQPNFSGLPTFQPPCNSQANFYGQPIFQPPYNSQPIFYGQPTFQSPPSTQSLTSPHSSPSYTSPLPSPAPSHTSTSENVISATDFDDQLLSL